MGWKQQFENSWAPKITPYPISNNSKYRKAKVCTASTSSGMRSMYSNPAEFMKNLTMRIPINNRVKVNKNFFSQKAQSMTQYNHQELGLNTHLSKYLYLKI